MDQNKNNNNDKSNIINIEEKMKILESENLSLKKSASKIGCADKIFLTKKSIHKEY